LDIAEMNKAHTRVRVLGKIEERTEANAWIIIIMK
jgi:hypothetical protein